MWDDTAILIGLTLVAFFFVWRKIRKLMGARKTCSGWLLHVFG